MSCAYNIICKQSPYTPSWVLPTVSKWSILCFIKLHKNTPCCELYAHFLRPIPQPLPQPLPQRLRLLPAPRPRSRGPSFKTFLIIKRASKRQLFENVSACCENMSFRSSSRSVVRNNYSRSSCSQNGTFRRRENATVHIIYNYIGVKIILSGARIVVWGGVKLTSRLLKYGGP